MKVLDLENEIVKLLQLPGPAVELGLTMKAGTLPRVEVLYYVESSEGHGFLHMRRIAYDLGDDGVRLGEELLEEIWG